MTEAVRASVIVPAHNAAATIGEQLAAIASQTAPFRWEVVVVLNRCTDNTRSLVADWCERDSRFRMIEANESAGASFARNRGVDASRGEFLAFCDADDAVEPEWLAHMVAALKSADVVGGRLEMMSTVTQDVIEMFPLYSELQAGTLSPLFAGRVRAVVAASMACSRSTFALVGGFDEEFVHGFDDVAFSLVAQQKGLRLGFAGDAKIQYRPRPDVSAVVSQRCSYARGYARFVRKYAPYHDEGLTIDCLRLVMSIGRAAVPIPTRLTRQRLAFLRIHAMQVYSMARERRAAGNWVRPLAVPGTSVRVLAAIANRVPPVRQHFPFRLAVLHRTASWPLVDTTLPLDLPMVGGLAISAPQPVAGLLGRWSDLSQTLAILGLAVRPGDVVIDIGAHAGIFTVAAERIVGHDGAVVSVEPVSRLREAIEINHQRHGCSPRSKVIGMALGDQVGQRAFYSYPNGLVGGFSESVHTNEESTLIAVNVSSVDTLHLGRFDLMKIDVEGAEIEVLKGAAESLASNPDAVIVAELNLESLRSMGHSYEELLRLLGARGDLWVIDESGASPLGGHPTPMAECEGWIASAWTAHTKWYANVVAVPSSDRFYELRRHLESQKLVSPAGG